jgi:hypothetical protein
MIRTLSSPGSILTFAVMHPFHQAHLFRLLALAGAGAAALGLLLSIFQRNGGAFTVLLGVLPCIAGSFIMFAIHGFKFEFFAICAIASVMAFTLIVHGFRQSHKGAIAAALMVPINAVYLMDLFMVTVSR